MMQNSLERVLAGIAMSLRDDVLPQLDDAYARSQVEAAIELVASLIVQTEWRCEHLRGATTDVREMLAAADRVAPAGDTDLDGARAVLTGSSPDTAANRELVAAYSESFAALAGVQRWLARRANADDEGVGDLADAVGDFVRRHFDTELDRYGEMRQRVRAVVTPHGP